MNRDDPGAAGAFPLGPGLPEAVRGTLVGADAAGAREHLASDVVGWLTTVAADGRPRTAVIAANGAVSFNLNCDPYGDQVVVIEGRAQVVPIERRSDVHPAFPPLVAREAHDVR